MTRTHTTVFVLVAIVALVLGLTVNDALDVFAEEATIRHAVESLRAVGLGYLRLGQGAPELS